MEEETEASNDHATHEPVAQFDEPAPESVDTPEPAPQPVETTAAHNEFAKEEEPVAANWSQQTTPARTVQGFTAEEKEAFVQRFINEYFEMLGLNEFASYETVQVEDGYTEDSFPFTTFEDVYQYETTSATATEEDLPEN